jgi:hypothetical protein
MRSAWWWGLAVACGDPEPKADPPEDTESTSPECEDKVEYYVDQDGDGVGVGEPAGWVCELGPGQAAVSGDCDDSDPARNPSDQDGDGVTGCDGDCDDTDPARGPFDRDGDGATGCEGDCDDDDPELTTEDLDADGYSTCEGDCDDQRPEWSPDNGCVAPEHADIQVTGTSEDDGPLHSLVVMDLDGDGAQDLLVQTWESPSPEEGALGVALLPGPWSGDRAMDEREALWYGTLPWDYVGLEMVAMGDLDGDGLPELGFTRPWATYEAVDGFFHLLYGSAERPSGEMRADSLPGWGVTGDDDLSYYDRPVPTPLGDVDGDGFADYALSHSTAMSQGDMVGKIYLVYGDGTRKGGMSPVTELDVAWTSHSPQALGSSLAAADLDGDGIPDLVMGADGGYTPGKFGRAYVAYGSGDRTVGALAERDADASLFGTHEYGLYGISAYAGPDLDGDGHADFLVRDPYSAQGEGAALWAYLGGSTRWEGEHAADEASWLKLEGRLPYDEFGSAFSVGDLTQDGQLDLAVGAFRASDDAGVAYVFAGPFSEGSLDASDAVAFVPGAPDAFLGAGLQVVDLDGSGGDELVLTAGGMGEGQVLIFGEGTF